MKQLSDFALGNLLLLHKAAVAGAAEIARVKSAWLTTGKLRKETKSDGSSVTEADLAAQKAIFAALQESRPYAHYIGEEGSVEGKETCPDKFYVDPIDGTSSFLRNEHTYTISIALEGNGFEHGYRAGLIYYPEFEAFAFAYLDQNEKIALRVLQHHTPDEIRHLPAFPRKKPIVLIDFNRHWKMAKALTDSGFDVEKTPACSMGLVDVANGQADAFVSPAGPEYRTRKWDYAAGVVVVAASGGSVTQIGGEPLTEADCSVLASSGDPVLHARLTEALKDFNPANKFGLE